MPRRRRLWTPPLAFGVVGSAGVVTASYPAFQLRGGVLTTGLYVLSLQVVLSALALSATDDLRDPQLDDRGRRDRRQEKGRPPDTGTFHLRRALWQFHLWNPLPACVLAFGVSIPLSFIAIDTFDRRSFGDVNGSSEDPYSERIHDSELALGSLLILTVLLTAWRGGSGIYGWVVGFATGVVVVQSRLNDSMYLYVYESRTMAEWALFSAALLTCLRLSTLAHRLLDRRRREQPA